MGVNGDILRDLKLMELISILPKRKHNVYKSAISKDGDS